MYSPRISEQLIPQLYQLAKARRMPMTQLVNSIIREALTGTTPPDGNAASGSPCLYVRESEPRQTAA